MEVPEKGFCGSVLAVCDPTEPGSHPLNAVMKKGDVSLYDSGDKASLLISRPSRQELPISPVEQHTAT